MKILTTMCLVLAVLSAQAQLRAEELPAEKKINIYFNKTLLTSFTWYDSVMKPVLYPLQTTGGITVTRQYPFALKPGERVDHPHQVGMFFTHESVNGHDFWNLSPRIVPADRHRYGNIQLKHYEVHSTASGDVELVAESSWHYYRGQEILKEKTVFVFHASGEDFSITRQTTLTALGEPVVFKDAKDAMMGLRLARALEMPNDWKDIFVGPDGKPGKEAVLNSEGTTGHYRNSEGITDLDVWGKKARWITLSGVVQGKPVSIAVMDHRNNPGYPTYWHARGYGLLSANPLGTAIFTNGKETTNLTLRPGESVTFRHLIIIREGSGFTDEELNRKAF